MLDAAGVDQKPAAGLRQVNPAIGAVEQPGLKLTFQLGDPSRQGGLSHVLARRRPAEIPGLHDGQEVAEQIAIHDRRYLSC